MSKYDRGEILEFRDYMAKFPYIELLDFDDRHYNFAIMKFKVDDTEHQIIKGRSGAWLYREFLECDDSEYIRLLNSISYSQKDGSSLQPGYLIVSVYAKLVQSFQPHTVSLNSYSVVSFDDVFKLNFNVSGITYTGNFKYGKDRILRPDICDDYCLRKFHAAEIEFILSELSLQITERFKEFHLKNKKSILK